MKRFLLFVFAFSYLNSFSQAIPTCSLDPVFISSNKNGVWPDSATNFISGSVGTPYEQNLTVKVPIDTIQTLKFCFNRVVVSTPSNVTNYNLPPGLFLGTSTSAVQNGTVNGAASFKFPGNANNCASIYGTPTTQGTYTLSLKVETYASLAPGGGFGTCPQSPTVSAGTLLNTTILNYYIITINPPAGLNEKVNDISFNLNAFPNPAKNAVEVSFNVEDVSNASIALIDILGKEIINVTHKTNSGKNKLKLDLS
ncbi:MAG: T9SS type A sorting domain-containing protein, partial [Flavobacteriales bacterium]|nr:T9SS type A sorting domain-containing protein [Flavobacteriales bacterium]